jgi:Domain of unknown function (DUF4382)
MRSLRFAATLAILPALLAACADDGIEPPSRAGETRILLTDAPFPYDRVARVDLHVVSVSGSLSADTSSAGQFVTLATPDRRINVLELQNGTVAELASLKLPAGAITAVRMVIDTDKSSITLRNGRVLTSTSTPGIAWQSSAGRPTLNALIHEQILVPDSGGVAVVDFDVGRSFITPQEVNPASTDSGFVFSPVLHAADANRTGSIAGTVRAGSATGTPVADASLRLYLGNPSEPENTWSMLATARSDGSGRFTFAYVTRSAYWAGLPARAGDTYIVAVDPPSGSGLGRKLVPGVTVAAKAETSIGTVVLP